MITPRLRAGWSACFVLLTAACFYVSACADAPSTPNRSAAGVGNIASIVTGCNDYDYETEICWDDCDYEDSNSWCYDPCFPDIDACMPDEPDDPPMDQCDPAVEPCGDGGGGSGDSGDGDDDDEPCDPALPGCKLPLRQVDSTRIVAALNAARRTTFTNPDAQAACARLFTQLQADWNAGGMFFRGSTTAAEGAHGHDAQFDGQHYHVDEDYLHRPDVLPRDLLELLMHEAAHRLNYPPHPAGVNEFGGYDTPPYSFTTPGTRPEPNACVLS